MDNGEFCFVLQGLFGLMQMKIIGRNGKNKVMKRKTEGFGLQKQDYNNWLHLFWDKAC